MLDNSDAAEKKRFSDFSCFCMSNDSAFGYAMQNTIFFFFSWFSFVCVIMFFFQSYADVAYIMASTFTFAPCLSTASSAAPQLHKTDGNKKKEFYLPLHLRKSSKRSTTYRRVCSLGAASIHAVAPIVVSLLGSNSTVEVNITSVQTRQTTKTQTRKKKVFNSFFPQLTHHNPEKKKASLLYLCT